MVRELNQSKHHSALSPSDSASYFLEAPDRHTGIHSPYGESSLGPEDRGSPMNKHSAKDAGFFQGQKSQLKSSDSKTSFMSNPLGLAQPQQQNNSIVESVKLERMLLGLQNVNKCKRFIETFVCAIREIK